VVDERGSRRPGRHRRPAHRRPAGDLPPGAVAPVDVEVFPTGAVIRPSHRLRIGILAFDVSHLLPLTIHTSPQRPSTITLPTR
jgi:predicted acyl esterase